MTEPVPPRLHVILARRAPYAVIFRRGPSKQVCLLGWNLETDEIQEGQWLKGRIYPMRSDLSPDGRHLIYFAMNGRWQDEVGGSWTAVSRAPWLSALHLYGWGHCWNGGGHFVDDKSYWLNTGPMEPNGVEAKTRAPVRRRKDPPKGVQPAMGEDIVTYFPRLLRDGWTHTGTNAKGNDHLFTFTKPVAAGWTLEKTFHTGVGTGPWGECYWDTHALFGPDGREELPGVEWADLSAGEMLFAQDGALWRRSFTEKGPDAPRMVRDLGPMRFQNRKAPYDKVEVGGAKRQGSEAAPGGWHPLDAEEGRQ